MNTKQFKSLAAVGVLWLVVGAGCKKEPPEPKPQSCNDGTCCMADKATYTYHKTFENEPADLLSDERYGNSIVVVYLKSVYPTHEEQPDAIYQSKGGLLCELSADKVKGLAPSAGMNGPFNYKYRVWGNLYTLYALTITGQPVSYFYITRIEKAP